MGLLDSLLGGGQRRQEYDDFVNRYDQGAPWDGISDDEAATRYREVSSQLDPNEYEESAAQAFDRLSPQQRMELGRHMREHVNARGVRFPDLDGDGQDDRFQDPRVLAQYTAAAA